MNFKELREANLSKAQIKKVHDKADDLPKNDFIKRYGKEGDAVRFATATNIVKKQLGIESLDKEDEKSVGRVIKQLKKAVKAHQGQVDTLAKDIKDEFVEGGPGSGPQKSYKTIPKNETESERDIRLDKATAVAKAANDKRISDAIKKMQKQDEKQKKKDKANRRKDEVELDEVHFSNRGEPPAPKGMHKLRSGRDIPSTSKVDAIHKKVVAMTDRNDHSGARIEIAKACGDKQLVQIFNALELIHDKYSGAVGNEAITLRGKMMNPLNKAIERKFGKYADVIQDAL